MPLNIAIGILSLFVTLVLYTIAVWGAFRAKSVTRKHLSLLWVGFFFDVVATTMMAIQAGGIQHDLHSIIAFAGMFGMLAVAIFGTLAYTGQNDSTLAILARWAIVPWLLWAGVFVWGMISRGAERVGA